MKRLFILLFVCFCFANANAAYLRNIPMTLTQPDGTVLQCFASGDEFFNYLHDVNGFTIMQHPQTGFYVYADKRDGNLVATDYVAGRVDPASKNLQPFNLISPQEWIERRNAWQDYDSPVVNRDGLPNHGTLNNISIFIRFSDDTEFTNSYSDIDNMFNDVSEDAVSMRSYFRTASYGAIEIPTTFYPGHNGDVIVSYQDTYPRSYFEPYNASTNPNGYQDDERTEREFSLLERAVNYINANYPIPTNLNIDYDNDGYVDNVCFIVRGGVGAWSSLLWPHKWALYGKDVYINGKRVWTFNFQLADATGYFNTSTMCHEMNHSLGAPDLYHYSYSGPDAVGIWDLMHANATPPQHCGAYMKMKYGHWIDEIPEITQAGTYTLNPISSATPTNIAYKIQSDDPSQYYVLEYRDNTSLFETALPGSGLLVYRIDTRFSGNADYNPSSGIYDEVYIFRPGGSTSENGNLYSAYFSSDVGRTEFSSSTSAYPFFTDGTIDNNFRIYNITSAGNTISFTYGTSSECNPPINLVATLVDNNVSLSWDAAANAVSYNIYRGGTLIGNTSGTTYTDSNIAYGIYNYFLKSVDANGLYSTASETVTINHFPENAVFIGNGSSSTNDYLPSFSYYKYALTQQIYTAEELGEAGIITSMAFYNGGATKTRTYDFYLKTTTKSSFSGTTDWEVVTQDDKVFSGDVTMVMDAWTFITLDNPFEYDGISNVVLVADDNSGRWTNAPHMSCRVFNAPSKTLRVYSDDTNYDPITPESYTETAVLGEKNQLIVMKSGLDDCLNFTPTAVEVAEITHSTANVTWTGYSESYIVAYRDCLGLREGFEGGEMPAGWTIVGDNQNANKTWRVGVGDYSASTGTHSGSYNALITHNNRNEETYLISPAMNLSGQNDLQLSFWYVNRNWLGDIDGFGVYYRVDGGVWNELWSTTEEHSTWTNQVVTLSGLAANYQLGFKFTDHYGYGVGLDDITFIQGDESEWQTVTATGSPVRLTGLLPETNYEVKVQGVCDGTETEWSGIVTFTTPEPTLVTQTFALSAGSNWVSFNVEIALEDLQAALVDVLGASAPITIKSKTQNVEYQNGSWTGSLTALSNIQMYKIIVSEACEITLEGVPIDPTTLSLTITPGTNWIAFPYNESISVTDFFGSFPMNNDVVKSQLQNTRYKNGRWAGQLNTLVPGQGYMYNSASTEDRTFTFPTGAK